MRRIATLLLAAAWVCAQTTASAPLPQEQERDRVRALVEAGALPAKALAEAEEAVEQARDAENLRATLYGRLPVEELTEETSERMLSAATRQWERHQRKVADAQRLVDAGALSRTSLTPFLIDLDHHRRVYDEAVSRSRLFQELAAIVKAEQELALEEPTPGVPQLAERFDGSGVFSNGQLEYITSAYRREFGKPLPVSARGETALHRSLGFDHRGRLDVALYPDSKEGAWLRRQLEFLRIPYYAFRGFVPGKSTAAHIHIGPPSLRIARTD
ncbi:MAG: hypothetical protein FJW20_17085 [Acidimicrobiia bacterium]|nr:hypothetical protein [Acidimicrobiia bacterium]